MKTRRLEFEHWLRRTPEELFPFFADAFNLERITPPLLRFQVVTPRPIEMGVGTLIDYRLKIRGVPVKWRTRISAWEPPHRFVDEQLRGPYHRWVHEHIFVPQGGGTLCRDRIDYVAPGGALVDRLVVRPDVLKIFGYRREVLERLFG